MAREPEKTIVRGETVHVGSDSGRRSRTAVAEEALASGDAASIASFGREVRRRRERHPSARLVRPVLDASVLRGGGGVVVCGASAMVVAVVWVAFAVAGWVAGVVVVALVLGLVAVVVTHIAGVHVVSYFAATGRLPRRGELASVRRLRRVRSMRCPGCGYELRGLDAVPASASGGVAVGPRVCPECGLAWPLVPEAVEDG